MGGKGKLLWLINKLAPNRYARFVDVFGGSGTVTLDRPLRRGCIEIYNDFNSNLTNLFCCVKERPMALLRELGFLPLNARDDFNVLYKFFSRQEFTDDYLEEELELTQVYFEPPQREMIQKLMLERSPRGCVRRAADYYKLVRYSFSGGAKAYAGRPCDIRRFFHLIWECSRRLKDVVIENKDFEELIAQYDRENTFFYCDPPYFNAECYGLVMVSYNYCPFICELYQDFYIFYTTRPNSMSQIAGSEYEEVVMTNYDPRVLGTDRGWQIDLFQRAEDGGGKYRLIHEPIKKQEENQHEKEK